MKIFMKFSHTKFTEDDVICQVSIQHSSLLISSGMSEHPLLSPSLSHAMFGYPTNPCASSEFLSDSPLNFPTLCPLTQLTISDSFDSVSSSGSYINSPSSLTSCCTTTTQKQSLMPRSVSSHSLQIQKNGYHCHFTSGLNESIDSDYGSVRRVFSTGDLDQGISTPGQRNWRSESTLSRESNSIIEGMSRASPYSPQEKRERIQRYRSKRNLRNFNKTIKYTCRKTLADRRPRIRGRFARNEEILKNPNHQVEWSHMSGEEEEEDEENWITFLDLFPPTLINPWH